jgi:23S rRNA (adenine1618-N6)-methyltransferase
LCKHHIGLKAFVHTNQYQKRTIDFANPKAVKALNTALLKADYNIDFWEFPDTNLCPPIPGRVDYIHYLNDLLVDSGLQNPTTILDIGTGATCIYMLLGHAAYSWHFIGSDVDKASLETAQTIIDKNKLSEVMELRFQTETSQILKGVLDPSEKIIAAICNPPFFKSEADALAATRRKLEGLGATNKEVVRNFSGTQTELWYQGGEKAFLHNYLYESSLLKTNCFWFTSLVSNKEHVKSMQKSLKKLGATKIKVINMSQGNKISRVVAWTFLTDSEQKEWQAL